MGVMGQCGVVLAMSFALEGCPSPVDTICGPHTTKTDALTPAVVPIGTDWCNSRKYRSVPRSPSLLRLFIESIAR